MNNRKRRYKVTQQSHYLAENNLTVYKTAKELWPLLAEIQRDSGFINRGSSSMLVFDNDEKGETIYITEAI